MSDANKSDPAKTAEVKPIKKFTFRGNDLDVASKHIIHWHVFVPDHVKFEEILHRDAWKHIAQHLQPMAQIHVTSESNKFVALLHVVASGPQWVVVEPIWYKQLEKKQDFSGDEELEVAWINNKDKHGVRRISDGMWLERGFMTTAEATQAMTNLMRDMRKVVG